MLIYIHNVDYFAGVTTELYKHYSIPCTVIVP